MKDETYIVQGVRNMLKLKHLIINEMGVSTLDVCLIIDYTRKQTYISLHVPSIPLEKIRRMQKNGSYHCDRANTIDDSFGFINFLSTFSNIIKSRPREHIGFSVITFEIIDGVFDSQADEPAYMRDRSSLNKLSMNENNRALFYIYPAYIRKLSKAQINAWLLAAGGNYDWNKEIIDE